MSQQGNGQKDQKSLPGTKIVGDSHTRGFLKDIETTDEQERGTKINGEGDGDVSGHIRPPTNPGCDTSTPQGGQDKCLIVPGESPRHNVSSAPMVIVSLPPRWGLLRCDRDDEWVDRAPGR